MGQFGKKCRSITGAGCWCRMGRFGTKCRSINGADGWWLLDDKMANVLPNPNTRMLVANTTGAYNSSVSPFIDIYSNGFKLRSNWSGINADGSDYIYLALGQTIVGTNKIAAVAR